MQSDPHNISNLLKRLETWLAKHRRRYLKGLQPPARQSDFDAVRKGLGFSLPAELQQLLGWHNGQGEDFIGCFEQSWNLMSTNDILTTWQELTTVAGTSWQRAWIPFLDDDASDYLCLDTSQPIASVRAVWRGNMDAPVAAVSLAAWLEEFVGALERGEYHEDSERGTMLRRAAGHGTPSPPAPG